MTTDFRALCAELLAWAEKTSSHYYKQADVLLRARAALAEPVGEKPRELQWPASVAQGCHEAAAEAESGSPLQQLLVAAGDLLERGCPAAAPVPEPGEVGELVAWLRGTRAARLTRAAELLSQLSERPWERQGWCDKDGRCWFGWADEPDASWSFCKPSERDTATVSIPANALPLPELEVNK